ncbi:MAG: D-alanine--D-alanine ligase [Kiloniellales bacterium]|nr:D-alanine--D-alanine ligase [Kiloniellales bacterium]
MSKRVAVLYGGISAEREVSLVSGRDCGKALGEAGYTVDMIDVTNDVGALTEALMPAPDAVFNALHGRWGEDGCVQGLLELLHIPYTHSGVMASALAMDKEMAKRVFLANGLRCAESVVASPEQILAADPLPRPYVVKPVAEGSSVGVRIVQEGDNEPPLDHDADWQSGAQMMVERFIPGRELTVSVMGERPLAVTELKPKQGFYDYEAKYTEGKTVHEVPAQLPEPIYEECLTSALEAHQALGCRGVSRADFRYDDSPGGDGQVYLLEVNTQPGMTPLSLVPEQAAHLGISFPELCGWLVENATCKT